MKTNIICMVLFVLFSTNIAFSQNNKVKKNIIRRIEVSEIQSGEFKKIYEYFQDVGFLVLPAYYDMDFTEYWEKNKLDGVRPYPYSHKNGDSPFYVNVSKKDIKRNVKITAISSLYNETIGDYILGVIMSATGGWTATKWWLVTFDFSGNVIDYIPMREFISDVPTIEAQINKDFTVEVQRLDFPDNDCIIEKDNGQPLDNLKGQRIDTRYEIATDGKFKKLIEVRYQPQIYPPSTLLDKKVNIRDRGEKKM